MSLRDLQQRFAAQIEALAAAGARPPDASRPPPDADLLALIEADGLTPLQRLGIYANNFRTSLTDALRGVYPAVAALVGDGFFGYLAASYLAVHPSRSGNLHDFGAELPAFVASFEPAATLPYLPDVARLEWAWHHAFHAPEHAPLDLQALAAVAPAHHERLLFRLHPSATLLASAFPFASIWAANVAGADGAIDLDAGRERVLVFRPAARVEVHALAPGELALLEALAGQRPFAAACAAGVATDADLDVSLCLQRHVALGTLVSFVYDNNTAAA